jgi:hypothetical protein
MKTLSQELALALNSLSTTIPGVIVVILGVLVQMGVTYHITIQGHSYELLSMLMAIAGGLGLIKAQSTKSPAPPSEGKW